MISQIFRFDFGSVDSAICSGFQLTEVMLPLSKLPFIGRFVYWPPMMMVLFLAVSMFIVLVPKNAYEKMQELRPRPVPMLLTAALLVWCIFSFGTVSAFLYFNF